ncbi:MAG: L-ribulose-5-phosphate 4-epimerase AraD [Armatimonadetes bacterium]|nr:L-ribulose-5-phosphate 4-epimerase AraD [Armatimonadota bacterium]
MLEKLKARVCEANLELKRSGLVILTWGNVSGIDRAEGLVAIKPSGVDYDEMRPVHMVIVDLEGKVVEGDLRPSSDTPTHLVLYREFQGIGGVAHTHSTHATAWAQACRGLPCYGTTHADYFRGDVPVTARLGRKELQGDYERETGLAIVKAFRKLNPHERPAVLVANHGAFTWGPSPEAAVENSIVLEQVAEMAAITERLSLDLWGQPLVAVADSALVDKHFLRKHGKDAYYGQG